MRRKNILTIILASILLLSVVAVTYAYFQGGINNANRQTATVTAGTMELTFADNDQGIGAVMNFGDTITKKFTIENTGTVTAYAKISWLNLINTYLEGSLIYTLEYSDTEDGTYKQIMTDVNIPRSETMATIELADGITVPANTKRYYNLHITLVNSPTVDQTADLSATFSTYFTIENGNSASNTTLATLKLANSVKSEPSFNMFNFSFSGYYGTSDIKLEGTCTFNNVKVNTLDTISAETACTEVYNTYLMGYVDSSIKKIYVGEATWDEGTQTCTFSGNPVISAQTQALAVKETCHKVYYYDSMYISGIDYVGAGKFTPFEPTAGIYAMEDDFGTSYYFRGSKSLNNIVEFGQYTENIYTYSVYNFKPDQNEYAVDGRKGSVGNLAQCQSEATSPSTCNDNNKIASAGDKMYWRIIRINGNGTLRLMYMGSGPNINNLKTYIGETSYNESPTEEKHNGYTYDNSAPNVQDGTESFLKQYIDTWYERTMTNYDNYVSKDQFFNDTRLYSNSYLVRNRNESSKNPILKTADTTELYGGTYYLKSGTLNLDEVTLSGFGGFNSGFIEEHSEDLIPFTTNFDIEYHTISPVSRLSGNVIATIYPPGLVGGDLMTEPPGVIPVINLNKKAIDKLIGSGSTIDPYRFE